MKGSDFVKWLERHNACQDALDWIADQRHQTPQHLWKVCPRGDWMAWLLAELGVAHEARASAWKAYGEARASAWKAYDEARASAWKAYAEAIVSGQKAYDEATASARNGWADELRAVDLPEVMG